jgi:hypothetical protein
MNPMSLTEALRIVKLASEDSCASGMYPGDPEVESEQAQDFCVDRGWHDHFADTRFQVYEIIKAKVAAPARGIWPFDSGPQDVREERELEQLVTALTVASRIAFLSTGLDAMKGLVRPVATDGIIRNSHEAYGLLCRQLWDIEATLIAQRRTLELRHEDAVATKRKDKEEEGEEERVVRLANERVSEEIASRTAVDNGGGCTLS